MITVEIVAIGNEILLGRILDTNSNYLCRVVTGLGGQVRHTAVVRDEIDMIAGELKNSLARCPRLILTCGGLGPTDDDLTLAGVARATARPLEVDAAAKEFVAQRYRELASQGYVLSGDLSEARLKMARLPKGARMVANPVGAAPAVLLDLDPIRIVSLPGVPAELKAVVEGPLQGLFAEVFGDAAYRELELTILSGDESELAPALSEVSRLHPEVYVKSRASRFGPGLRFRVVISTRAPSADEADRALASALDDLKRTLARAGIGLG